MRDSRVLLCLVCVASLLFMGGAAQDETSAEASVANEIRGEVRSLAEAWIALDAEAYLAHFADDHVFVFQGNSVSHQDFESIVRGTLDALRSSTFEVTDEDIVVLGADSAIATFGLRETMIAKDEQITDLRAMMTLIYAHRGGEWTIVRAHESLMMAQPDDDDEASEASAIKVEFLEIVTPMVEETCGVLSLAHGVEFSDPIPEFGFARVAPLSDGGMLSVRAPMRETEMPVVRPYVLVDDIEAAVKAAEMAGAEIAIPPLEIPGRGTFAIYLLGGIDHGLWER